MADSEGFIVAYPQGDSNSWNAQGQCCGSSNEDDVQFIRKVVAAIQNAANIDSGVLDSLGAQDSLDAWQAVQNCSATETQQDLSSNTACQTHACPGGVEVRLSTVSGGGRAFIPMLTAPVSLLLPGIFSKTNCRAPVIGSNKVTR